MQQKLIDEMADILETEASSLSLDTKFKTDDYFWDSLKGYATLVMIEDEFEKTISVDDFIEVSTIGELKSLIEK